MSARTAFGPFGFGLAALLLAALAALVLLTLMPPRDALGLRWAGIGWGLMTVVGVVGGIALVRCHGRPAHGFFVAAGASMLTRLGTAALGAWGAARAGESAIGPYLAGLAAGYLPLQILEVGWLLGRTRTAS